MKKYIGLLLSLLLTFSMILGTGTTAFAADASTSSEESESVIFKGAISGYGSVWHNYGDSTTGDFYVNVTGSYWPTGQITLNIESFGSNDAVAVQVFKPNGVLAYGTLDNAGDYITMANANNWHNIKFANGMTGTYRVHYSIINWNGDTPSSGRINCWIY